MSDPALSLEVAYFADGRDQLDVQDFTSLGDASLAYLEAIIAKRYATVVLKKGGVEIRRYTPSYRAVIVTPNR